MSNTIGTRLKLTVFGESHGPAVGMTLEGFPAGFEPDLAELQAFLNRRAPSASVFSTSRREADAPKFLSGLHDGRTCGDALTAIIRNTNARRADYANFLPRPSHADYPAFVKYGGAMDLSGGGCLTGFCYCHLHIILMRHRTVPFGKKLLSGGEKQRIAQQHHKCQHQWNGDA